MRLHRKLPILHHFYPRGPQLDVQRTKDVLWGPQSHTWGASRVKVVSEGFGAIHICKPKMGGPDPSPPYQHLIKYNKNYMRNILGTLCCHQFPGPVPPTLANNIICQISPMVPEVVCKWLQESNLGQIEGTWGGAPMTVSYTHLTLPTKA